MTEYTLILSSSGTGMGNSLNKLKMNWKNYAFRDIEDKLKMDYKTEEALKAVNAPNTRPIDMGTVTHYLPRTTVATLWEDATLQCLKELKESDKKYKILSGHLLYFGAQRDEFYSVINTNCLSFNGIKSSGLILLLDDIYDMYQRLTKKSQLFSPEFTIDSIVAKGKTGVKSIKDINSIASKTMSWQLGKMLSLFSWRHTEIVMAESLANQLGVKYLPWSIKQLSCVMKYWIENVNEAKSAYLSHSISRLRKEQIRTGKWPKLAMDINKLQNKFYKNKIVLIMPTGIDELRLNTKVEKSEKSNFTGYLNKRWPLISDSKELVYTHPDDKIDTNYREILLPKYWDTKKKLMFNISKKYLGNLNKEINSSIYTIIRQIESQIASRDHLLVSHADNLIVFRPFYGNADSFSKGVKAEIQHFECIVNSQPNKYAAFIHLNEDVVYMLKNKKRKDIYEDSIYNNFINLVLLEMEDTYGIKDINLIKHIIDNRGSIIEKESILNKGQFSIKTKTEIKESFPNFIKKAKIELLRKYLNGGGTIAKEKFGVWIFDNNSSFINSLAEIVNFLQKGTKPKNNWEKNIDYLFPDSYILPKYQNYRY